MPVEFLTSEQKSQYGKFNEEPTKEQLAKFFLLDGQDFEIIKECRGSHNKLGFAVQLGTVRFLGKFLKSPINVPFAVVDYIAKQLNINSSDIFLYNKERTIREHINDICKYYGYQDFNSQPYNWRLIRWIYRRVWLLSERPIILFDLVTNKCVEQKILLPGVTTLTRLIAKVYERASKRLWKKLSCLPSPTQKLKLNELLILEPKRRYTNLDFLRHVPTTISPNGIVKAIERLKSIRSFGLYSWNTSNIPIGQIRKLSKYTAVARSQIIQRMPDDKKTAHLVAFVIIFSSIAQDNVIDILDKYLAELFKKTNSRGNKNKLRTGKTISVPMRQLLEAFKVILDEKTPDDDVRTTIFEKHSKTVLNQAYNKVDSLAKSLESTISFHELFQNYSSVRKFLPLLFENIEFKASKSGQKILKTWDFMKIEEIHRKKKNKYYKNAPLDGISESWLGVTRKNKNTVYACGYTFWVLSNIHSAIKNREIFVFGSEQYDDPASKLIQETSWKSMKSNVLNTTKWSNSSTESINPIIDELDQAYKHTSERLSENKYVRFEEFAGKKQLILTNLEKREEKVSYKILHNRVQELLPKVDLPALLFEVNSWTGFFDSFTHINGGNSRVSDLDISICAIMIAKACNIGFEPVICKGIPALEYDRLTWIAQNYIRMDTIEPSRIKLNKHHFKLPMSQCWGKGEVVSADGTRLVIPVKSITSGHNSKFFGTRKGITNYSLISDMFDELNFLLQSGASKDSVYLPQCVLEQPTSLNIKEIMTDTGGYSDLVFGIFALLEYQFSPRIADVANSRFWRIDKHANYGELNDISKYRINVDIIHNNWDDMLRVMASLKMGTVNPTNLIRMLQRSGRPTKLGRAIIELGRIYKTLYQLTYIDDPDYRRAILTQLNKGETRNSLTDAVNYGRKGEIYQPYQEGQEEQMGILGLVVNAIVHWNTRYIGLAVDSLRNDGMVIDEEDLKHLSPICWQHINIVGRYSFLIPEEIKRGSFRTLRNFNTGK